MSNAFFDELPEAALLRLPQVQAVVGIKRSTIYALIQAGRFPVQKKLTQSAAGWRVGDIRKWLDDPTAWRDSALRAGGEAT